MIVDNILSQLGYVSKEATENLRSAEEEFNQAELEGSLTRSLCRKYSDALADYKAELDDYGGLDVGRSPEYFYNNEHGGREELKSDASIAEERDRLLARIKEEQRRISEHEKTLPPGAN